MVDIQATIVQQPIEATVIQQKVEAVIPGAVIISNAVINYIGEDGKSAYESAVENGFIGTVGQWLDSLVGGPGPAGLSAYQVALANGFVGTEAEWLEFLQGTNGDDGREVEIRNSGTHIQRRYVGDPTWINIVALSALKGDTGENIELQATATHIQWRVVGSPTWTNLIAFSLLQGTQGIPGLPGADGLSAYEVAVNNGFVGTESERLDSMRDYNNLVDIPTEFPPSAHTHSWLSITSKPTTFTPSAHGHTISEILGLSEELIDKESMGVTFPRGLTDIPVDSKALGRAKRDLVLQAYRIDSFASDFTSLVGDINIQVFANDIEIGQAILTADSTIYVDDLSTRTTSISYDDEIIYRIKDNSGVKNVVLTLYFI